MSIPHILVDRLDLVLASASPRRREILQLLSVPFRIQAAECDETPWPGESPADRVARLARTKALIVTRRNSESVILAADTVVVFRGEVIGKPANATEAIEILHRLRNQRHTVLTAVAMCAGVSGPVLVETVETHVWMRGYTEQEIADYVATGDPLDKAAAYAIQHSTFRPVLRTEGCPVSVMGLPLCVVAQMFERLGFLRPTDIVCHCMPQENVCTVAAQLSL